MVLQRAVLVFPPVPPSCGTSPVELCRPNKIIMVSKLSTVAVVAAAFSAVSAQTFQRLGTCPDLGCILPPDQQGMYNMSYARMYIRVVV